MKKQIILTFVLVVIFGNLVSGQNFDIKFEEVYTIGDLQDAPKEYLFGKIDQIAVDSKGNFYVADKMQTSIKKYSTDGKFICSIGRRGSGPNEYKTIHNFLINSKDEVVVADHMMREIVVFSANGNGSKKYFYKRGWSTLFSELSDGNYILFNDKSLTENKYFLVLDSTFQRVKTSFGKLKEISTENPNFDNYIKKTGTYLTFVKINENSFLINSLFTGNKSLLFIKTGNDWQTICLKANHSKNNVYKEIDLETMLENTKTLDIPYTASIGRNPRCYLKFNYYNLGYFVYREKYILSFYAESRDYKNFDCKFDIFSINGEYLKTCDLSEYIEYSEIPPQVMVQDKDYIYLKCYENDYPVIRKMRLNIKKTEN